MFDSNARIVSTTKIKYLLLVAITFFPLQGAPGQGGEKTLRQVLSNQNVSLGASTLTNLDKRIASYAILNNSSQVAVAYTLADEKNEVTPSMHVDRYDRRTSQWFTTALGDGTAGHPEMDFTCTGSLESIHGYGAQLVLETTLNPDAGCTLLFSEDLKLEATLFGWLIGRLNDELIYERSEVHFAAVHPTQIWLYDTRNKQDFSIFPRMPYPSVWMARIEQLREFYRTHESWCKANNDPCDPEQFDSSLIGDVATSDQEKALAFIISYEQIQGFTGDQKPSGPKQVVYVYRNVDNERQLEYREMLMSEVQMRFGDVPLIKLLEPERLKQIFSTPSE